MEPANSFSEMFSEKIYSPSKKRSVSPPSYCFLDKPVQGKKRINPGKRPKAKRLNSIKLFLVKSAPQIRGKEFPTRKVHIYVHTLQY
jgi:hypothetical protein